MAMIRTQIYLTEEQRRKIKQLAKLQYKSMAQVVREAVEEYMIRQTNDLLRDTVELDSSGITDGSIHQIATFMTKTDPTSHISVPGLS